MGGGIAVRCKRRIQVNRRDRRQARRGDRMTRLHYLTREVGLSKRDAKAQLRGFDWAWRGLGDGKIMDKIRNAERVRHCKFTISVGGGEPF